jgi:hypothetical protein
MDARRVRHDERNKAGIRLRGQPDRKDNLPRAYPSLHRADEECALVSTSGRPDTYSPTGSDLAGCLFKSPALTGASGWNLPRQMPRRMLTHFRTFMRLSASFCMETETARKLLSASRLNWLRG